MELIAKFIRNEDGATAIEYGLIAAFIGIAVLTSMSSLSPVLQAVFAKISAGMN